MDVDQRDNVATFLDPPYRIAAAGGVHVGPPLVRWRPRQLPPWVQADHVHLPLQQHQNRHGNVAALVDLVPPNRMAAVGGVQARPALVGWPPRVAVGDLLLLNGFGWREYAHIHVVADNMEHPRNIIADAIMNHLGPERIIIIIDNSDNNNNDINNRPHNPTALRLNWAEMMICFSLAAATQMISGPSSSSDPGGDFLSGYGYPFAILLCFAFVTVGHLIGGDNGFPRMATVATKSGIFVGTGGFVIALTSAFPTHVKFVTWACSAAFMLAAIRCRCR